MLEHSQRQQAEVAAGRSRRHLAHTSGAGSEVTSGGATVETIPLTELRPAPTNEWSRLQGSGAASDALRQLHAQSSAETSGVGDSLQRIHALSSTETSGYGADPLQSPTDLASITSPSDQLPRLPAATTAVRSALPEYRSTTSAVPVSSRRSAGDVGVMSGPQTQQYNYNGIASPPQRYASPTPAGRHDDDEQFYVDDDDQSTSSRGGRYSRPRARRSNGGVRGTGGSGSASEEGEFLGRSTQSAWLRWSHERRASYRRKVENLEKRQSDMERFRVSSPVRKARQESARLSSFSD